MDENGMIDFNRDKIHIRDLFFEIFMMGKTSHEDFKNKDSLQTLFEYWLKEKLKQL